MKKFSKIVSRGELPDGRIIHHYSSYPLGADIEEYRRIDRAMTTAFIPDSVQTKGTYLKE